MNSQINPLIFFFGYGLVFFPLFQLIGPLISELFLVSLIIFCVFKILSEKKTVFYKNKFLVFFLFFYISTLYSTLSNYRDLDHALNGIFF